MGLGVTLVIGAVLGLAVLALYVPAGPLVPALDSYWLVIHVSAAAISGGAFTIGAMASILYVLKSRAEQRAIDGIPVPGPLRRLPAADAIDAIAYKVHAFAFPLWTFGVLVAGPIWAEHAWGRYWNWDPKEVWSFVVWVIYAAYLHARATAGWRTGRAAWINAAGFAAEELAAAAWLRFAGRFLGAGPLARLSASSSAARSEVIVSISSPRRNVALISPSVTYGPKRPSLINIGRPDAGSAPSSLSGGFAAARPRCLGWA